MPHRKITYTVYDDFGRVTRVGEAAANFCTSRSGAVLPLRERRLVVAQPHDLRRRRCRYRQRRRRQRGRLGGPNYAQGRLTRAQENTDADAAAEVVHRYAYDHLVNVRVKQVEIEGLAGAKTLEYVYDLAGRITGIIYPDGAQARYAYDSAGRLSRVGDAKGNTLVAYTHTAAGNIETHVAGEDIVTGTYTYNPREWVTDLNYAGTFRSKLTYDLAGNVTRQEYSHGSAASKTADYAYDDLYRITGFDLTGGTSRDYAYDRSGNLKSMVTGSSRLTYNYSGTSTPNRLDSTAVGSATTTYAYNQNGWMTRKGADTVRYDYRGLTTGYGSARYLMDPDRRRVKKKVGTATTYYVRGPGGSVLAEYAGQNLSARYVYAGSRRIARIGGGGAIYYLADHLGSTRSLVDGDGAVTAAYDYWPYGKVLATSGKGATHFRFTGHERDSESGLDYMLARSYAYDVGRFLRPDPMQDEFPGISPYAYANNNPLKYVDPDGLNHHEPHQYLNAKIASEIRTLKLNAVYAAKETIQTSILASDAVSEVADYGVLGGLASAGAGLVTANPVTTAGSLGFVRVSAGIGTGADALKTVALTADALFFEGSSQEAFDQFKTTLLNFVTSRTFNAISRLYIKPTNFNGPGPSYRHSQTGEFVSDWKGGSYTTATEAAKTLVPDDDEH